jgi:DNA transformation protein
MGSGENSFVAFVLDELRKVPGLGCRAMFGGHGLYRGGTFFGIVFAGRLYLKTDGATVGHYTSLGMRPFQPNDRQLLKTYYEVPADVLEDRDRLVAWAEAAAGCADRGEAGAGGPADVDGTTGASRRGARGTRSVPHGAGRGVTR